MAVSMAKALGATDVCLPSAGNAGSALAAYAAAAGLKAHVFLPRDIAKLFVMETEAYGAHVEMVDGLITDAGRVCAAQAKQHGWYECATLKEPYRVEGKKTMGYEIAEQLGWTLPDAILYPTGGGTGLVGMWKAFAEMETMGFVGSKRPRMYAVQADGCAPIVKAFQEGRDDAPLWEDATTHAHGLRVPKALGDFLILRGVRESHGSAVAVSEAEIVAGVKEAAAAEGLFMAPEGGACVAAARKLQARAVSSRPTTTSCCSTPAPATSTSRTWHRSGTDPEPEGDPMKTMAVALLAFVLPAQMPMQPAKDLFMHSARVPGVEIRFVDYHWQPALFEAMEKGSRRSIPEAKRNWVVARVILDDRPLTLGTRAAAGRQLRVSSCGPTSMARAWRSRCAAWTCGRSTPT